MAECARISTTGATGEMGLDHRVLKMCRKTESGFSLIDVAVVMAIVGILLAGFLTAYKIYQATRATITTEENFIASQEALGAFIPFKGNRYPRPAPFGVRDGQTGYGEEVDLADVASSCTDVTAVGKVCRSIGASGENVLIGVLPFADLNMSDTQARDGYGRLFTYAVSEALTQPNGNDPLDVSPADGVPDTDADGDIMYRHYVCVKTQDLQDDGSVVVADCTKAAGNPPRPIVLVSHGSDGIGAWLPSGVQYKHCDSAPSASQDDNCNYDGTFVQSMRLTRDDNATPADTSDDFDMRQPMLVQGANAQRNDDKVQVEVREDGNYWGMSGPSTDQIANKYNYKIGIGVAKPDKPLEVSGNIKAEEGVLAEELCGDGDCLKTDSLAGNSDDMDCGALGMVADIKNNKVICEYVVQPNVTCNSDEYVAGFDASGAAICVQMDATCGPAHHTSPGSAPTAVELCTSGTAGGFSGTGPWTWTCTKAAKTVNCKTL